MRAMIVAMTVLVVGFAASVIGCGDDREERGLALPSEQAVPMDAHEMQMTEQERREKAREEQAEAEQRDFDAAADPDSGS